MRYILGLFLLSFMLIACETKTEQATTQESTVIYEKVDAASFKSAFETDANKIILDVRTPREFNSGAVPNSINIDYLAGGFEQAVESLDKDKTIYIYCQGGVRSSKAAKVMQEKGFDHIIELENGFSSY